MENQSYNLSQPKFCPHCGAPFTAGAAFCTSCGQRAVIPQAANFAPPPQNFTGPTKFCRHCGGKIPEDAVICTLCGRQVEQLSVPQPSVVIHNENRNNPVNNNVNSFRQNIQTVSGRQKNKWVALLLCVFLGWIGGHKFYEGKIGMGLLYFFTGGLFVVGAVIDFLVLLTKPNPYYV